MHQAKVLGASGPSKVIKPPGVLPLQLLTCHHFGGRKILAKHGMANIYAKFEVPVSTKRTKKNPTHKSPDRHWSISETPGAERLKVMDLPCLRRVTSSSFKGNGCLATSIKQQPVLGATNKQRLQRIRETGNCKDNNQRFPYLLQFSQRRSAWWFASKV